MRDSFVPESDESFTTIALVFHVFHNDNGSNPSRSDLAIENDVAALNADYLPARINFVYKTLHHNSTRFRSINWDEIDPLKETYAFEPEFCLNIFVTQTEFGASFGTFPWAGWEKSVYGGIVLNSNLAGIPHGLTHEIGHCLGLWHTHRGVSEVSQCGMCYESVGAVDRDNCGDFCSDTDPTPANGTCDPPPGMDTCSGEEWGRTDVQNFMGFSEPCYEEFSPQQMGRMRCWIQSALASWTQPVTFSGTNLFGGAPLEASFDGMSFKTVTDWSWNFGDGATANVEDPTHTYANPGLYSVSLSITATDSSFSYTRRSCVWAYADTVAVPDAVGEPGHEVRIDICARNYLPLTELVIPFVWAGPAGIGFDSASVAGLRTSDMPVYGFSCFDDQIYMRAAYRFAGDAEHLLPTGSGPVVSLYMSVPAGPGVLSSLISIEAFDNGLAMYEPKFVSPAGEYSPVSINGTITLCGPGDINNDGWCDLVDLSHLVTYLTGTVSALPNMRAANCNRTGIVDLVDLSYLVAYLSGTGVTLACGS